MNPWALMAQSSPTGNIPTQPHRNPLEMGHPPLGALRPRTSTFMPGTGTGAAKQAHPYDSYEKRLQRGRDLTTHSFASEGVGRE